MGSDSACGSGITGGDGSCGGGGGDVGGLGWAGALGCGREHGGQGGGCPECAVLLALQGARRGNTGWGGREPPPLSVAPPAPLHCRSLPPPSMAAAGVEAGGVGAPPLLGGGGSKGGGTTSVADSGGGGGSGEAQGVGRGAPLDMSSQEVRAWLAHQAALEAWGWRVRLGGVSSDGGDDGGAAGGGWGGVGAGAGGTAGGCGVCAEVTQVPVVYGTPLGPPDLTTALQQLAATTTGSAPHPPPPPPQLPQPQPPTTAAVAATTPVAPGGHKGAGGAAEVDAGGVQGNQGGANIGTGAVQGHCASALLPPGALRVLRSRACRTALMFGDPLLPSECAALVRLLAGCALWHSCAHGRPTVVPLAALPALRAALRGHTTRPCVRLGAGVAGGEGFGGEGVTWGLQVGCEGDGAVGGVGGAEGSGARVLSVKRLRQSLRKHKLPAPAPAPTPAPGL